MFVPATNFDSEIYTLEYFLQNDVCRLCWNRGARREIYHNSDGNCEVIPNSIPADTIRDNLGIDLTQKIVPNRLCQSCAENVEDFCNFKIFCQETDKRLRKIFADCNSKSEFIINNAPSPVKIENHAEEHTLPEPESIDDFLDSLRPSDLSSDDERPLKRRKTEKPTETKTKRCNKNRYCNICKTEFETLEEFAVHSSEAHGIEDGYFKCFGCGKKCKTRRGRVSHEITFCKNLKDGYKCHQCAMIVPTRGLYEKHMKSHREKGSETLPELSVKCRKCPLTFKTRKELLTHHKAKHDMVKKEFICESCGRVFTRIDYLHKHKLTHTGTKQQVCTQCGFRTTQRSSLIVHMRKHTGERPYGCDLCPLRCVSSSNLKAHRRRHLGDKRYECNICSKKFGYKVSLDEHIATAHVRADSHVCTVCGTSYTRIRGLKRHMLAKHGGSDKVEASQAENLQENAVGIVEVVTDEIAEALKGDEVYVKLQNDTYVKVLQVKEAKSLVGFELKGFDAKMACVDQNGKLYDVKLLE